MIIISWNIQGAKKPQIISEVHFLSRTYKADIIFLLETMVNETNVRKILPQMGFEHFDYVLPTNHSGGIAVLWNNGKIHASPLLKEPRAIYMLVHDPAKGQNSIVSGIYAPAQPREKTQFWEQLTHLNEVFDVPWCLLGDFNELGSPEEKKGGQPLSFGKYQRLNKFISDINAETIQVKGSIFTWKKKIHTHLIYERLDRTLARKDSIAMYPNALEEHGSFTCSDPRPIIVSSDFAISRHKAFPFRFQIFWCNYSQVDTS